MRKQDFHFELPQHLIANEPCERRSDSRLMILNPAQESVEERYFYELDQLLQPNDCLIFNNTQVIPARLIGQRDTGGQVEILIERVIPGSDNDYCVAQIKASNKLREGAELNVQQAFKLTVVSKEGSFYRLKCQSSTPLMELVEEYGSMPLPPYIKRAASSFDKERYQTVYATKKGAVAAPTAGLHFDQDLMGRLAAIGVAIDFVTLHVGAGTFSPIRVDDITQHQMHTEWYEVPPSVVELVRQTREKGGRVIAVGTTAVRCLESASTNGLLQSASGETDIFIYPGYEFQSVDGLITNFHLSESSLLMLVSAFAGQDFVLDAYKKAVDAEYRFFSYGDAMLIENRVTSIASSSNQSEREKL